MPNAIKNDSLLYRKKNFEENLMKNRGRASSRPRLCKCTDRREEPKKWAILEWSG